MNTAGVHGGDGLVTITYTLVAATTTMAGPSTTSSATTSTTSGTGTVTSIKDTGEDSTTFAASQPATAVSAIPTFTG